LGKETLNLINIFHFYLYENEVGSLKSKSDFGVVRNTNLHESEQISWRSKNEILP